MNRHALGLTYGLLGGLALSLGGPIVRLLSENPNSLNEFIDPQNADISSWQFLAWRSYGFAILMFAIAIWRAGTLRGLGRETAKIGWMLLPIAAVVGFGQICYVLGLLNTLVANVTFIVGSAPIFTAFAAWAILGERLTLRGFLGLFAAIFGVAIMFKGGMDSGALLGNIFALGAMVTYGAYVILLRYARNIDTFVASGFGGVIGTAFAIYMCGGELAMPLSDLTLALASGTIQVGFGFAFITVASKLIPAAQVTLLVMTEAVFGPIWVWLLINEVPPPATLLGGVVILASVAAFAGFALMDERRARGL